MLEHAQFFTIFVPAVMAFIIGIFITPFWTHILYTKKMWKKSGGKKGLDGKTAEVFNQLKQEGETKTPRMGGVIIWASVAITAIGAWLTQFIFPDPYQGVFDFMSRSQTWLPFCVLLVGAAVGFIDDYLEITRSESGKGGLPLRIRLLVVAVLGAGVGWWFYDKLDVSAIGIPFDGVLTLGAFIIPLFVLVLLAIYASGVIDGIDGLSGGVFATIFAAYSGISFFQEQYDLAALCATITGGILAFLWFNIPPARFYMTETGSMALTLTLGVVAFMTDTLGDGIGVSILPIVALPLVVTVVGNLIQVFWKKVFKKKLFRIAPIHHHFEAIGWPSYKVTMRYWVIGVITAIIGMSIAIIG